MDELELNDLDNNHAENEQEEDETDLGGSSEENDFLDRLDWLTNQRERSTLIQKIIWK